MKKERLKPYVHKVKGAVNYALYDIMNGRFYHLKPEGDIQTLRTSLKNAGLIFETEGEVPFKIEFDVPTDTKNIQIRELQIKQNGKKEDTCWQRNTLTENVAYMNNGVLEALEENLLYIPVHKIRIEVDEIDRLALEKILLRFKCLAVELFTKQEVDKETGDYFLKICEERDMRFLMPESRQKIIDKLVVEPYYFFYSQKFNPCLGEQAAVDINGDIKPCLWSDDVLGNILKDNLKDMIISGCFNRYWEMKKDNIVVCKECEKRYACSDCRVSAVNKTGTFEGKPGFCNYNPYSL